MNWLRNLALISTACLAFLTGYFVVEGMRIFAGGPLAYPQEYLGTADRVIKAATSAGVNALAALVILWIVYLKGNSLRILSGWKKIASLGISIVTTLFLILICAVRVKAPFEFRDLVKQSAEAGIPVENTAERSELISMFAHEVDSLVYFSASLSLIILLSMVVLSCAMPPHRNPENSSS